MSEEYYKTWERMIDYRMTDIYKMISAPEFLHNNKITFIEDITKFLYKEIRKYKDNDIEKKICIGDIYGLILPLQKHFTGEVEQTFISSIIDRDSMHNAIQRIKKKDWQYYEEVTITTRQSTPNAVAINYDGCGVGRGLKISGTLQYICLSCNKFVGFTEEDYWKHQDTVHNNPRVRTITTTKLRNKIKF